MFLLDGNEADPAEGLMKKKASSRAKKRMINAYLQQAVKLKIAA